MRVKIQATILRIIITKEKKIKIGISKPERSQHIAGRLNEKQIQKENF